MSSREFAEWMAFYQVEPWGEERADLRSGIVASTVANAHRDPKKRKRPFKPEDFIPKFEPKFERKKGRKTPEQMLRLVEMLNVAFGGKDLRKK